MSPLDCNFSSLGALFCHFFSAEHCLHFRLLLTHGCWGRKEWPDTDSAGRISWVVGDYLLLRKNLFYKKKKHTFQASLGPICLIIVKYKKFLSLEQDVRKSYLWKAWKDLRKQKYKRIGLQIYIYTYACLKTRVQSFSVKIKAEENKRPWLTSVRGQKHSMYFRDSPNMF